jgi:hypothetical protein
VSNVIEVDANTILPGQFHQMVGVVKKAVEFMQQYRLPYQTAFVLAHLDKQANYNLTIMRMSDGFIKAVHKYVWFNDSSNLTKVLQRNCDDAMQQMCKVSVKFDKK